MTYADYYLANNSCIHIDDIPAGSSINIGNDTVQPCNIDNCVSCVNNHANCTLCNLGMNLILKDQECVTNVRPTAASLTVNKFVARKATAEIRFSINMKKYSTVKDPFNVIITDTLENKEYTCDQIKCSLASLDEDGFG